MSATSLAPDQLLDDLLAGVPSDALAVVDPEVLTRSVPKEASEVEAMMRD